MLKKFKLDFQWPTFEPFLFCVHHNDQFPRGNGQFAPDEKLLAGRNLGEDFVEKEGFRMYHGDTVPGFPVHPHRGFETITIVRNGLVDHADSMGAAGRYGFGDVQWMTAGQGVQHSEMFPLLNTDKSNPVELFQIWLNLPKKSKMAKPHFTMFWNEDIPKYISPDQGFEVTVIAGQYAGVQSLNPPPESWASEKESGTHVFLIKIKKNSQMKIPPSLFQSVRVCYFFMGKSILVNSEEVLSKTGFVIDSSTETVIQARHDDVEVLVLESRPIGEPVVQHGPFVMNTKEEIFRTFQDYQKTQFGGWNWDRDDMVHGSEIRRFAQYPDGKIETRIVKK
ncbi:MAG: pirin [Bdellovibrionales bacterium RIFCSPHIGHO2_01_FULL_40_29]|nr:MAG: pirin [Bdellovibrionales bacterium RIFCSPHIGHO2_01_FULL_40_29]OFZ32538.1 MAG: pirin [Bdellovibrionales bacterium RIFCSPHIGHO2_02_FULL_40_15]